ncbi:MAG: hypothetical protein R3C56_28360 [Pirellulaceae bacterium]
MTRYLACELGQFGIRVNCVAGGPVYGDLLEILCCGSDAAALGIVYTRWQALQPDGPRQVHRLPRK